MRLSERLVRMQGDGATEEVGNGGVQAERSCFGIIPPVSGDDRFAVGANRLAYQSPHLFNRLSFGAGVVDSADTLVEICAS